MNPDASAPACVRAFVSLPVPAPVIDALRRVQRRVADRLPDDGIRWSAPDQIHLTLRFLGQVPETAIAALSKALGEAARAVPPFRLNLAGCGCFPDVHRPRVVWIGIEGETAPLLDLQRRVEAAVAGHGDHEETRPFAPHLTLGRIRPGSRAARALSGGLESEPEVESGEWTADVLHLMRSDLAPHGARHTLIARFPLGSAPAE